MVQLFQSCQIIHNCGETIEEKASRVRKYVNDRERRMQEVGGCLVRAVTSSSLYFRVVYEVSEYSLRRTGSQILHVSEQRVGRLDNVFVIGEHKKNTDEDCSPKTSETATEPELSRMMNTHSKQEGIIVVVLLNGHSLRVSLTLQVAINNQTASIPWFNHLLTLRRCLVGTGNIGNRFIDILRPEVGEMVISAISTGITRLKPQW